MSGAIDIRGLGKRYGKVTALDGVSLTVSEGELFGLIGPDGAGKTSLMRILATLTLPDRGEAEVDGLDVVKDYMLLRERIGYMPGRFALYQDLSVEENLGFYASLFGTTIEDNYQVIKEIYSQLEPFRDRRAGQLSGGMKQKLALCCALVHKPKVLILDEPTTGVDAVSRKEFWNILKRIRTSGVTVLVSTPYMDEAGQCDRVALLSEGRVLEVGTPSEIASGYSGRLYGVSGVPMFRLLIFLRTIDGVQSCHPFGNCHHLAVEDGGPDAATVEEAACRAGFTDVSVREIHPGIEDCFMKLSI